MENAVDALKIAFAVMVFTMALSLAISTFSQARETSEAVLYMNDKTNYYIYDEIEAGTTVNVGSTSYTPYTSSSGITYTDKRIVGIETIIPTLYRYYKENYTVIFEGIDDIYYLNSTTDKWQGNNSLSGKPINYFDLNSEIKANCPWVGTVNDIKKNLDLFLDGTSKYPQPSQIDKISFGNTARFVTYGDGFIEEHQNDTFLEELGEYATDRTYGMNNGVLQVQDSQGNVAEFEQKSGNLWNCTKDNNNEKFNVGDAKTLEEIATEIGSSASTFLDEEFSIKVHQTLEYMERMKHRKYTPRELPELFVCAS